MLRIIALFIMTLAISPIAAQSFDDINKQIELDLSNSLWLEAQEKIEYCLKNFELDGTTEANLNHNLGFCLLETENYIGAKFYLQTALEQRYSLSGKKRADHAKTSQLLGDLSLKIGDFDRAFSYLSDAQKTISSEVGVQTDQNVDALISIGQYYESTGNYLQAHHEFDKALQISREIHHELSPEFANVINHIGRIFIRNNELDLADKYLTQANSIYKDLGDEFAIEYVESLENLALLFEERGNFAQAEKLLLDIESEKRQISDLPEELLLETLNDLGILYLTLNNVVRSKKYFEEVKTLSEKQLGVQHKYYATAINNLAAIAKREEDYIYAQSLLKDAILIYEKIYGKNHPQTSNALNNLASVERLLGNYLDSEVHYKEVLQIDKLIYGENHPVYATGISNLGILYSTMGRSAVAGQCYMMSKDIRESVLGINHPSYARSVENLGLHYYSLNKFEQAERYLKEAIDIQIGQISSIFPSFTEQERAIFYQTIREDIERYTFIAYQLLDERPELIQVIMDHHIATKGILFSSAERIRNLILSSQNNSLIREYQDWSDATLRLAGFYQMGDERLGKLGIDIRKEEEKIEQMEKSLMLGSDIFSELFDSKVIGWEDIRNALETDQALVEVVRFREFSNQVDKPSQLFGFTDKVHYMFIILKSDSFENPDYVILDNGAALETKGFSLYANSLKYESELRTSYLNYWEPIDEKLSDIDNLILSPDGVYYKMNPNILKFSRSKYLIDKYNVTYITRSKDLLSQKTAITTNPSAVLIGNPDFGTINVESRFSVPDLPGAQKEVEDISAMLSANGWEVKSLLQRKASEASVKAVFQPTILHMATHGFFSDSDPIIAKITPGNSPMFKSGLFLRGVLDAYQNYSNGIYQDPQDDGILSSFDAMSLNLLGTRLVVLSACETSLGDIEVGEGVYGLQRAMITAGAENLITSMTKVDDYATQLLMKYFYEQFLETDDVKKSFRDAQLKLREKYPDPKVWGAFLLTGNG